MNDDTIGIATAKIQSRLNKAITGYYKLVDFIQAVRSCSTVQEEKNLISNESAALRTSFKNHSCSPEQRYHSVAKLLFLFHMGYPAYFGQIEVIKLVASTSPKYKRLGYVGSNLLLDEQQQTLTLITNSIKIDLNSPNTVLRNLALSCLAAGVSVDMSEELANEIEKLLKKDEKDRSKLALCASKIVRNQPELFERFSPFLSDLLNDNLHSNVFAGACLGINISKHLNLSFLLPTIVKQLQPLLLSSSKFFDLTINSINNPFLQIKLIKLIRVILVDNCIPPSDDIVNILTQMSSIIPSSNNTGRSILIEIARTIFSIKCDTSLVRSIVNIFNSFFTDHQGIDSNMRYVTLTLFNEFAAQYKNFAILECLVEHYGMIISCLEDDDPSIRGIATNLLITLMDFSNIKLILPALFRMTQESQDDASLLLFRRKLFSQLQDSSLKFSSSPTWFIDMSIFLLHQLIPFENILILPCHSNPSTYSIDDFAWEEGILKKLILFIEDGNLLSLQHACKVTYSIIIDGEVPQIDLGGDLCLSSKNFSQSCRSLTLKMFSLYLLIEYPRFSLKGAIGDNLDKYLSIIEDWIEEGEGEREGRDGGHESLLDLIISALEIVYIYSEEYHRMEVLRILKSFESLSFGNLVQRKIKAKLAHSQLSSIEYCQFLESLSSTLPVFLKENHSNGVDDLLGELTLFDEKDSLIWSDEGNLELKVEALEKEKGYIAIICKLENNGNMYDLLDVSIQYSISKKFFLTLGSPSHTQCLKGGGSIYQSIKVSCNDSLMDISNISKIKIKMKLIFRRRRCGPDNTDNNSEEIESHLINYEYL